MHLVKEALSQVLNDVQVSSHIYFGTTIADIFLQCLANLRKTRADLNSLTVSLLLGLGTHKEAIDAVFASATDAHGRIRPVVVHGAKKQLRRVTCRSGHQTRREEPQPLHIVVELRNTLSPLQGIPQRRQNPPVLRTRQCKDVYSHRNTHAGARPYFRKVQKWM